MTSVPDRMPATAAHDRRRIAALVLLLGVLTALSVWRLQSRPAKSSFSVSGYTMGTTYRIRIDADPSPEERASVHDVVQDRLDRVDRLMSTFDTTSEVSRFNRSRDTVPFPVSREVVEVLSVAAEVSAASEGAFDVTVAPLVDAWGFGPEGRPERIPDASCIAELMERVGHRRLRLDRDAGTLSKSNPETVIDLSAVAKGYGVESVATALQDLGFSSFLVEVGGELKALGRRRDGSPWRAGIERPDTASRSVYGVIDLENGAIATSGDYRNFYEDGGVRYAHVVDPRTGVPIRYRGISVSVVHDDAAVADAWATALAVLGPDTGYDLAVTADVAALFVIRSEEGFESRTTPAFAARTALTEVNAR